MLGLTSGGRGYAGECGGANNPTVYVRIKTLENWIRKHVKDDLCVESEERLKKGPTTYSKFK